MTQSESEARCLRRLYQLLYQALVEIRQQGREAKNAPIFGLANLLHVVPLELERAAKGEISYEDVYDSLTIRADELNCRAWIDGEISRMESPQYG